MSNYLLVALALLPAIGLLVYIYIKDRSEKEPIGLLLLLVLAGVLICFPAVFLEDFFGGIIDKIFSNFIIFQDGQYYFFSNSFYYGYHFTQNFVGVALIEEGLKWLVLFLITRKNKNFNSLFDGIIYAVCVSLGFAAFENVLYVLENGITNALTRALTAVPGHMFFAVFMGCYYTEWHLFKRVVEVENNLYTNHFIPTKCVQKASNGSALFKSFIIPILIHGFYDFLLTINPSSTFIRVVIYIVFLAFLALLYFFSFKKIRKISKSDADDTFLAVAILCQYHPGLSDLILKTYNGNSETNTNPDSTKV